jgi:hypothetical protein
MSINDLEERLAPLASQLASIQEARNMLSNHETEVKAQILALVPGPDRYQAGAHEVLVSAAHRLDLRAIASKYPLAEHPELYTPSVDVKKVRAHFAPIDMEPLLLPSAPSVKLL